MAKLGETVIFVVSKRAGFNLLRLRAFQFKIKGPIVLLLLVEAATHGTLAVAVAVAGHSLVNNQNRVHY